MTAPTVHGGGASVSSVAEGLGVTVLPSADVVKAGLARRMVDEEIDLLLNVHSLHVIHADVVAAPRIGSFNLHPGPLPEYAGLNAPSWAIYEGERRHAVTVHWMQPEVDTGAVAYASWFDVEDEDTGLSLSTKCIRAGVPLVGRLLRDSAESPQAIPAVPQDPSRRRYFRRGQVPDDGRVVWSRQARRILDFVRACDFFPFTSPWGEPVASFQDEPISVLKASGTGERTTAEPGTVGSVSEQGARVATGDEWVLVQRVRLHDGPLPAGQVLKTGARLEDGVP
jgi:UDP-4-amino-4-deoxy-L-arabinose formyltransferase/UDP-glucuronic acid dehydrogenase (UDP-4-keto-hexauronic acid decarboxylating)